VWHPKAQGFHERYQVPFNNVGLLLAGRDPILHDILMAQREWQSGSGPEVMFASMGTGWDKFKRGMHLCTRKT